MFQSTSMIKMSVITGLLFTGLSISGANAQSTLTLDSFDIEDKPAPKSQQKTQNSDVNAIESCLTNSANCDKSKFKSSSSFSIDDVVNLGIIDREEVRPVKASTDSKNSEVKAEPLPSIDMEILFDYDSDIVRQDQFNKLIELSNVLKNDRFNGFRFAFLGHTDAKGSSHYNHNLSYSRAKAVSNFLISATGFAKDRVIPTGMGSTRLKTPHDPHGAANRRVQLVLIPVR